MGKLEDRGIATRQGTHAIHTLGYYQKKYSLKNEECPNSLMADRFSITLPLYASMSDEEQEYVVGNFMELYDKEVF